MYQFHVEGMTCEGCIKGVKRAVQSVDTSAEVMVDLAEKTVEVSSDSGMEAVRTAIHDAGYPVIQAVEI